jgi:hypothetical protein
MLRWRFINVKDEMSFIRKTHKIDKSFSAASMAIYGSEKEQPDQIVVFGISDPRYTDRPLGTWIPVDGKYVLTNPLGSYQEDEDASEERVNPHLRSNLLRGCCANPIEYDAVIEFIRDHNPQLTGQTLNSRESYACDLVHGIIRALSYNDLKSSYISSGLCMGVRASMDSESTKYHEVYLTITGVQYLKLK